MNNLLVPVAEAARLLSASEGTVATWLDNELLREWSRGPKRRIVDVREALLLCGLRHDLHQTTPALVRALDLDLEGTADSGTAADLAHAFAGPTGLPQNKLEPAIARYLALGYTTAEVAACLERIAAYRGRAQRSTLRVTFPAGDARVARQNGQLREERSVPSGNRTLSSPA